MNPTLIEAWAEFLSAIHALIEGDTDYIIASASEFEFAKERRGKRLDRARAAFHRLELLESSKEFMELAAKAYWYPHYPDLDYFRSKLGMYFEQVESLEQKEVIWQTLCAQSVENVSLLSKKLRMRQDFISYEFPIWDEREAEKHVKCATAMLQNIIDQKKRKQQGEK